MRHLTTSRSRIRQTREIFGWTPGDGMKLSTSIEKFIHNDPNLAKNTRKAYHGDLQMFLASVRAAGEPDSVYSLAPAPIKRFLITLKDLGRHPGTISRKLTAITGLVKYLEGEGWTWKEHPLRGVKTIKVGKRLPRPYRKDDLAKLMRLPLPLDQRVIRALLYYTGIRVTPLTELRKEHVDLTPFTLDGVPVAGKIRTKGKGGKIMEIYVVPRLAKILQEWFDANPGMQSWDLLFSHPAGYGRPAGRPYTARFIQLMTHAWARAAGLPHLDVPKGCTPHRFRHSCGTDLLDETDNLALVQEWLGHESIATTRGYAELSNKKRAKAALGFKDWEAGESDDLTDNCRRTTEDSASTPQPTS